MAKAAKNVTVGDLLHAAVKNLTPYQAMKFRRELERRLPEVIDQAAQAAQQAKREDKSDNDRNNRETERQ